MLLGKTKLLIELWKKSNIHLLFLLSAHQIMCFIPMVVDVQLVLRVRVLWGCCRDYMVRICRSECCHKAPQQVVKAGGLCHTTQQPVKCLKKKKVKKTAQIDRLFLKLDINFTNLINTGMYKVSCMFCFG